MDEAWVPRFVMGNVIRLVTPRRVKSPVTSSRPFATSFTAVLLKVMVGNFSTSKQVVRLLAVLVPVLVVQLMATSMAASTEDLLMSCHPSGMRPLKLLAKRPGVRQEMADLEADLRVGGVDPIRVPRQGGQGRGGEHEGQGMKAGLHGVSVN